jgi:hypothetical protein
MRLGRTRCCTTFNTPRRVRHGKQRALDTPENDAVRPRAPEYDAVDAPLDSM